MAPMLGRPPMGASEPNGKPVRHWTASWRSWAPVTERITLVADRDDDDADEHADGDAELIAPAARIDLVTLDARFTGPAWLTGGVLGTEASFLMYPALALLWFFVWWRYRGNPDFRP